MMVIVGLNLLIAVMSDCYTDTKDALFELLPTERARTIIEVEDEMSDADKANPEYFPQYLQVLRIAQHTPKGDDHEDDAAEETPRSSSSSSSSSSSDNYDEHRLIDRVRDEVEEATRASVRQVEAKVDRLSDSNAQLAAEMAAVKALLQELVRAAR
jgi:hypothetical protein